MSVSVTHHLPIPGRRTPCRPVCRFVEWDARVREVRQTLDDRSRLRIAIQRFLAGDANSFRQSQFSEAREPSHGLRCGFVLDVERR